MQLAEQILRGGIITVSVQTTRFVAMAPLRAVTVVVLIAVCISTAAARL